MKKLTAILKGWENYIFPDEQTEIIAKERAFVCAACPLAVKGSYQKLMPDFSLSKVQGMKCSQCRCPLSTLLRQNEEICRKWKR